MTLQKFNPYKPLEKVRRTKTETVVLDGSSTGMLMMPVTSDSEGEMKEFVSLPISLHEYEWVRKVLKVFDNELVPVKGGKRRCTKQFGSTRVNVESENYDGDEKIARTIYLKNDRTAEKDLRFRVVLTMRGDRGSGRGDAFGMNYYLNVDGNPTRLLTNQQLFNVKTTMKLLTLPIRTARFFIKMIAHIYDIKGKWSDASKEAVDEGRVNIQYASMDYYSADIGVELRRFVVNFLAHLVSTSISVGPKNAAGVNQYKDAMAQAKARSKTNLKGNEYKTEVHPDANNRDEVASISFTRLVSKSKELHVSLYAKDKEQEVKGSSASAQVAKSMSGHLRYAVQFDREGLRRLLGTGERSPQLIDLFNWCQENKPQGVLKKVSEHVMETFGIEYFLLGRWILPGHPEWAEKYDKLPQKLKDTVDAWLQGVPWMSAQMGNLIPGGKGHRSEVQGKILSIFRFDPAYPHRLHEVADQAKFAMETTDELRIMRRGIPEDHNDPTWEKKWKDYGIAVSLEGKDGRAMRERLKKVWDEKATTAHSANLGLDITGLDKPFVFLSMQGLVEDAMVRVNDRQSEL